MKILLLAVATIIANPTTAGLFPSKNSKQYSYDKYIRPPESNPETIRRKKCVKQQKLKQKKEGKVQRKLTHLWRKIYDKQLEFKISLADKKVLINNIELDISGGELNRLLTNCVAENLRDRTGKKALLNAIYNLYKEKSFKSRL